MKSKTIIFLGPQGSGKGTQVEKLASHLDSRHEPVTVLQTGKPFRDLSARGGFAAELVRNRIEKGKLIPNAVTNALVISEMMHVTTPDTHLIFDGYPRDVAQAEVLDEALQFFERSELTIVHLDSPDSVVIKRMKSRGRSDDTDEGIAERLRLYHSVTKPVLAYYQARPQTVLHTIDGALTIEEVASRIRSILE
jgi:adenylate kinase